MSTVPGMLVHIYVPPELRGPDDPMLCEEYVTGDDVVEAADRHLVDCDECLELLHA